MINAKIECPKCQASGLWQGPTHGRGAFVECPACRGKGWSELKYERFIRLKEPKAAWGQDAARVLPAAMEKAQATIESPEGVSYTEWLALRTDGAAWSGEKTLSK